jgi:hypothetical protein
MLEPRRLTTLWAFTACYRDIIIFYHLVRGAVPSVPHTSSRRSAKLGAGTTSTVHIHQRPPGTKSSNRRDMKRGCDRKCTKFQLKSTQFVLCVYINFKEASSPDSDADRYAMNRKLLRFIFNTRWKPNCHIGDLVQHIGRFFRGGWRRLQTRSFIICTPREMLLE